MPTGGAVAPAPRARERTFSSSGADSVTGQETDSTNERPQFTVNPCKPLGETCEAGYDCCDGYCRDDGKGKLVCQQKGNECAKSGEKCTVDGDCCEGTACIGGFCAPTGPK